MNSDILGKPGEGIHFHVFGVAIVDVALTVVAAWALSSWTRTSLFAWTVALFAIGIVAHRVFGVKTTVDKAIFGS